MAQFFTVLYIKTNRISDEKIAIGVLANLDDIPYFGFSVSKLNFALKSVNSDMSRAIKRSLGILENDVNKILNGEQTLSLFDPPYTKKVLNKLTLKKRGILYYADLIPLIKPFDFGKLYHKYIGEDWQLNARKPSKNISFKKIFNQFSLDKRFNDFTKKHALTPENYPFIYTTVKVDLLRRSNYYTVFHHIDFQLSLPAVQRALTQFKLMVRCLSFQAKENGLGKGRYYLVYESKSNDKVQELINKIRINNPEFELIKMNEMKDKV